MTNIATLMRCDRQCAVADAARRSAHATYTNRNILRTIRTEKMCENRPLGGLPNVAEFLQVRHQLFIYCAANTRPRQKCINTPTLLTVALAETKHHTMPPALHCTPLPPLRDQWAY